MGKAELTSAPKHVEVLADPAALARRVADWMLGIALEKKADRVAVALAGGSTPRAAYEVMASAEYRERFPWSRMHWFWGDERYVLPSDPRSNARMVREALLTRAPIPAGNIHPVPITCATDQNAAREYERELKSFYGAEQLDPSRPFFDINLLGVGEDGHFASLFPGSEALKERSRWVTCVRGAQPEIRITLTYPVLESARHAAFLVSGAAKSAVLSRLCGGDPALPATHFEPVGTLEIFADRAAASKV